jgi:hypothetical protein
MVNLRDASGHTSRTSLSIRLMEKPSWAAGLERTVGGSWQWSPARTIRTLTGFIDDSQIKPTISKNFRIEGGGGTDHFGAIQNRFDDLSLQQFGIFAQLPCLGAMLVLLPRHRPTARPSLRLPHRPLRFPHQLVHDLVGRIFLGQSI